MAKVTITDNSSQAATYKKTGIGNTLLGLYDRGGQIKAKPFTYTNNTGAAIAAGSYIELCSVGPCRILPNSSVSTSALGAARVLNLGLQEYTDRNGAVTAQAAANLLSALDVSAAVTQKLLGSDANSATIGAGLDVTGPTAVLAQVTGGTIPAGATINGVIEVIEN
ncbi:MAG TPA: hypothetical protein VN081_03930 [Dongiaceae bacterium]|nr:hypothetical protein [Dongiaceae bacterium]